MHPTIHYATTRDAVRVAFYTAGQGPAVVMLFPYHVNHLALNWHVPLHPSAFEFFARHFTVVNLDLRGAGLSDRHIVGLSLEAFAADIDAVLLELGLSRVGLCAMGPGGPSPANSLLVVPRASRASSSSGAASQKRTAAF